MLLPVVTSSLLTYSVSSLGLIALLYKVYKFIYLRKLARSYFKDKTVLITGASSGLGKSLAEELYPLGAQLIICARNGQELEKLKANLMKKQVKGAKEPEILILDVSSNFDIMKPKITAVLNKYKRIDILVNNAGVSFRGETLNASEEVYQKIMETNFFGAVRLTNLVVNRMIEEDNERKRSKSRRRDYSVVNIGSVQSYLGTPYRGPYCASKHALQAYTDSLRAELFDHKNINVVALNPGYINTNVSVNALTSDGNKNNMNDADHKNGFSSQHVAWEIINAILDKRKEVLVATIVHRVGIWIRFFFPNLYYWIVYNRARKMSNRNFQD